MEPQATAMPAIQLMLPSKAWAMVPGTAKIITAMSDVPEVTRMEMCAMEIIIGTMMKPPPTHVGVVRNPKQVDALMELGVYSKVVVASATEPVAVLEAALAANGGKEYDLDRKSVV